MKRHHLVLVIIIVFAAILRIVLFTGIVGSDDIEYNNGAYSFLKGGLKNVHDPIIETRLLSYVPVSLFFYLFGVNEVSSILCPFPFSIWILLLVYKIGTLFFDKESVLIAALLYAIFPIEAWKKQPLFLANRIGPLIRKMLPF